MKWRNAFKRERLPQPFLNHVGSRFANLTFIDSRIPDPREDLA